MNTSSFQPIPGAFPINLKDLPPKQHFSGGKAKSRTKLKIERKLRLGPKMIVKGDNWTKNVMEAKK